MAITLIGTPQAGTDAAGGDVTLTFDVAPQEGDVVYLCGGHGGDGTVAGPITSGYTQIFFHNTFHSNRDFGVWRKRMGATPDTTVQCEGGGDAADAVGYSAVVLRGVDATTPEDAAVTSAVDVTVNPDPPAITTVTDGAWVIPMTGNGRGFLASAAPSGYANLATAGSGATNAFSEAMATKEVATAGSEDPGVFTQDTSVRGWVVATVAVRPASALSSTSLLATGDGTIVDVVNENDAASPLFSSVDDDPSSPNDADWVNNAVDVT